MQWTALYTSIQNNVIDIDYISKLLHQMSYNTIAYNGDEYTWAKRHAEQLSLIKYNVKP